MKFQLLLVLQMLSGKRGLHQENFDTSMLLDAVTSLIDAFKQAGYNYPTSIHVDKKAFDKLLEEASKLYSSINVKDSIANQEFSIAKIINILLEGGKEEVDNQQHDHYRSPQKQKDTQQAIKLKDSQEKHQPTLPTVATKYECPDSGATFQR